TAHPLGALFQLRCGTCRGRGRGGRATTGSRSLCRSDSRCSSNWIMSPPSCAPTPQPSEVFTDLPSTSRLTTNACSVNLQVARMSPPPLFDSATFQGVVTLDHLLPASEAVFAPLSPYLKPSRAA